MARADSALGPAIGAADETGGAVAAQYEANPYPCWGWVQPTPRGAGRAFLERIAGQSGAVSPASPSGGWAKGPLRIAIAGCGTGQEAVQAALAYAPNAQLLAFDFSRASLRYAAMKVRQHGLSAIRFRQADILDLPAFEAPFDRPADLVECVGVLHHMADPFAGWRTLLARLRPGGLMYVGLYSATARRGLTALRERLAGQGVDPADPDAIRRVRARILARPENDFERSLAASADFYTLSNVRDLLFHAHERPLTLDAIGAFLKDERLEFLHMDVRPHIAEAFAGCAGRFRRARSSGLGGFRAGQSRHVRRHVPVLDPEAGLGPKPATTQIRQNGIYIVFFCTYSSGPGASAAIAEDRIGFRFGMSRKK